MTSIAIITPWDPRDERSWSGVIAPMVRVVEERFQCATISTADIRDSLVDRALCRVLDGRSGRSYLVGHAVATGLRRGREVRRRLAVVQPDLILAIAASQDVAFLGGSTPLIQISDTTLASIADFYEQFSNLQPISRRQAEIVSRRSARRASHTLAATDWARDALIRDDGIAPERVTVAPFGPAIAPSVPPAIRRAEHGPLRLLAVASDWHRKGGDRAVEVAGLLRSRGVDAELTIVGDAPDLPQWVSAPGRVSRDRLAELYGGADLLLELARSNAAGVTLTDAAGFGLPALATRSGGVGSIVEDGVTGRLLDQGPDLAEQAAQAILEMRHDLPALSEAALRRAERMLTWDSWCDRLIEAAGRFDVHPTS